MTEKECKRIANLHYFPECRGKVRKGWLLHHKDVTLKYNDPIRYAEWRIEDLQPMTVGEHTTLHRTGNHYTLSEKTRKKMSASRMGDRNPIHNLTEEQMKQRGIKISQKWRAWRDANPEKVAEIMSNIGKKAYEIPKERLDAMLDKRRQKMLGKLWWNNGIESRLSKECPGEGWKPGRICSKTA